MSEKPNPFGELANEAFKKIAIDAAIHQFEQGIVLCMKTEKVNLSAAISMVREHLNMEQIVDPMPEDQFALLHRVIDKVAKNLHARLAGMRELIALDDNGSPNPVPYDAAKAKQARDQLAAELAGHNFN